MSMKIWTCKVGEIADGLLPDGADLPMRQAVQEAFYGLTGRWPEFTFSGWAGDLTEVELAVVEDRPPTETREEHLLGWAWSIIANASGGDWTKETPEWQEAAAKWRDALHSEPVTGVNR